MQKDNGSHSNLDLKVDKRDMVHGIKPVGVS
jgi:hypothetical protein